MLQNRRIALLGGNTKPSINLDFSSNPVIPSSLTATRSTTGTVIAYAPTAVAGDIPIQITCSANEARFPNARRISQGVWSNVLNDGSAIPLPITLLAEEARTNLVLNSQNIVSGNFTTVPTLTRNQSAPDGTTNATLLTGSGTTAIQRAIYLCTTVANTVYTVSVKIKAGTARYIALQGLGSGTANLFFAVVDTTTMAFTNTTNTAASGTFVSRAITRLSPTSPWYTVSVTGSVPDTNMYWKLSLTNDPNYSIPSYSTTDNAVIYDAAIEAGTSVSSSIPTTSAAVTRAADSISCTGSNLSWYNPTQGTFAITALGKSFNAPYNFGALALTYVSSTKYALSYNNNVKSGSTYLYTAATLANPTEYTGVSIPSTIFVNSGGIANISRFTYYPKAIKPSKIASLL